MRFLRTALVVLSAIILAAHFLRSGDILLMAGSLVFPLLLLVRQLWAVRLVQLLLLLGSVEWIRTTIDLIHERQALGMTWDRLAFILVAVALLTAASAVVLEPPRRRAVAPAVAKS